MLPACKYVSELATSVVTAFVVILSEYLRVLLLTEVSTTIVHSMPVGLRGRHIYNTADVHVLT